MRLLPLTTAGLALLLSGCASTPKQTGFLTTYANLKAEGDALRFRDDAKLKNYTKFMIEPIVAHSHAGESAGDEVAVRRVTRHFREQLQTKLSANYQIVDAAGPGVAKLRIAPERKSQVSLSRGKFRVSCDRLAEETYGLHAIVLVDAMEMP